MIKKSHHQFNNKFLIELEEMTIISQIKKNKRTNIFINNSKKIKF